MFRLLFRRPAPILLVLGCSRLLVGVDAESSEVVRETPQALFFLAPTQSAPPTISPNITHFGSPVSSMRATNPANKIRLLRKVVSMLSLPVFISVSTYEIGWLARFIVLSPTDAASQEPVVDSVQRVVVERARAPRDAAVQHCLEYLGS